MIAPLPNAPVERFREDFRTLAGSRSAMIGIAVSGGPDSLALLLLASSAFPGQVAAATVDHGLRAEAAEEARFVASVCAELSLPHSILAVEVDPRRSSLQRAAREARYRALAGWCGRESLGFLATAHHLEDQAETLLMRLLRGSGVGGLAGIRAAAPLPGSAALLIRPLLGWRRAELAGLVRASGLTAVSDPSNGDESFDRVRIRRRLASAEWIDPLPLARSAAALADADRALAWATERVWNDRVMVEDGKTCFAPAELPPELVRRILVRILGPGGSAPRGEEIARLAARLAEGGCATLAGFRCSGGEVWRFERESPRRQSNTTTRA